MSSRSEPTCDLIKIVVDAMNKKFRAKTITEISPASAGVLGVYKLFSCNTLWMTIGFTITIDSVDYTITEIDANVSVTIKGSVLPSIKVFDIYAPHYIFGTVMSAIDQFDKEKTAAKRLPMIWLKQTLKETFNNDPLATIERESYCDLFFLADFQSNWNNEQHKNNCVKPMRNLFDSFYNALLKSKIVKEMADYKYEQYDHVMFGIYAEQAGNLKNLFNANLTGTEVKINIPFLKRKVCCGI